MIINSLCKCNVNWIVEVEFLGHSVITNTNIIKTIENIYKLSKNILIYNTYFKSKKNADKSKIWSKQLIWGNQRQSKRRK